MNIEDWLKIRPEILITEKNGCEIHRWTIVSFNKRTGNKCKEFKPNHFTNDIL